MRLIKVYLFDKAGNKVKEASIPWHGLADSETITYKGRIYKFTHGRADFATFQEVNNFNLED